MGDEYVGALRKLYAERIPGQSDLVCYWFEKARAMIEQGSAKCAGLLATQAIRAGASREVLKRIKETGNIFWAQSDREWTLNGAAVCVTMVGFDDGTIQTRTLDDRAVAVINPDLTTTSDLTQAKRLQENAGYAFKGQLRSGCSRSTPHSPARC